MQNKRKTKLRDSFQIKTEILTDATKKEYIKMSRIPP